MTLEQLRLIKNLVATATRYGQESAEFQSSDKRVARLSDQVTAQLEALEDMSCEHDWRPFSALRIGTKVGLYECKKCGSRRVRNEQ